MGMVGLLNWLRYLSNTKLHFGCCHFLAISMIWQISRTDSGEYLTHEKKGCRVAFLFVLFDLILYIPSTIFFCGSFMFLFCLVFAVSLCLSVCMCFVVTCWERADLLALVCGVYCEFVTFPLVSWVRCGPWLYRFLIFAPLLTFI